MDLSLLQLGRIDPRFEQSHVGTEKIRGFSRGTLGQTQSVNSIED